MAKVYTRTGDKGQTSLYTNQRVSKGSLRVEAYGTVDEADSVLGMARAFAAHDNVKETIYKLQKELWLLMADVASLDQEPNITPEHVTNLEHIIDQYTESLAPLDHFLVPGATKAPASWMWPDPWYAALKDVCGVWQKQKMYMMWISAI